ncbi:hypothetical protein TNCV_4005141 [Trichonephila clavipes]|nr:hypothetical protein TNCV_4005141 [Trichonephila clavipes]
MQSGSRASLQHHVTQYPDSKRITFAKIRIIGAAPPSMVAKTLYLLSSGLGFESRIRDGCIFGKRSQNYPTEMDSRLDRKAVHCSVLGTSFL